MDLSQARIRDFTPCSSSLDAGRIDMTIMPRVELKLPTTLKHEKAAMLMNLSGIYNKKQIPNTRDTENLSKIIYYHNKGINTCSFRNVKHTNPIPSK